MTNAAQHRSNKIRVLVVEDSRVVREFLMHIISRDPRLEVAAATETAEEALQLFEKVRPDVVSMDIRLPGMNGFEATQRIMAERPTPIVVVSASVEDEDLNISISALKAGALAVVEKPVGTTHEDYEALSERLCTQLAIMSQVKVVRQRFSQRPAASNDRRRRRNRGPDRRSLGADVGMIGIVSSTGGPRALEQIVTSLPPGPRGARRCPLPPIALVQHITDSFHAGFVAWLNGHSALPVRTVRHLEVPRPGTIYVAPADHHLRFDGERFRLSRGDPVCAERPSGTELFASLAESLGRRALGVLLTGMGEDGAAGLLRIRAAGGYTIAEDETTAVVYGMPAAAVRIGAVCKSVPLGEIVPHILERVFPPVNGMRDEGADTSGKNVRRSDGQTTSHPDR